MFKALIISGEGRVHDLDVQSFTFLVRTPQCHYCCFGGVERVPDLNVSVKGVFFCRSAPKWFDFVLNPVFAANTAPLSKEAALLYLLFK